MFQYRISTVIIAMAIIAAVLGYVSKLIRQPEIDTRLLAEFDSLGEQSGVGTSFPCGDQGPIERLLGVHPITLLMLDTSKEDAKLSCEQLVLLSKLSSLKNLWLYAPIENCTPKGAEGFLSLELVEITEELTFEETVQSLKSLSAFARGEFDVAIPGPLPSDLHGDCTDELGFPCAVMFTKEQIMEIKNLPKVRDVRASQFNFFLGWYSQDPRRANGNQCGNLKEHAFTIFNRLQPSSGNPAITAEDAAKPLQD